MIKCPKCGSTSLTYLKKSNKYVCDDCECIFAEERKKRIFFSYGHDKNEILVNLFKDSLSEEFDVWIDKSEIKGGDDWRRKITDGIVESDGVVAFLSKHSTRVPGVCLDEVRIALNVKYGNILTVLLEPFSEVEVPSSIADVQYLDVSDWKKYYGTPEFKDYFDKNKNELLRSMKNDCFANFKGEIEDLQNAINPVLSQAKEQMLLKNEFYGRKWLVNKINDWKENSTNNVLFMFGGAGFGKSSFVSYLSHYDHSVIASIYIEWDKENQKSPSNIIKTIAFKIATKLPDYRRHLLEIVRTNPNRFSHIDSVTDLFEELISKPLNSLIDGGRETMLVLIDGLDEAASKNDNELARILASELNKLPRWIKFILTSRPDVYVNSVFKKYTSIDLSNYKEENSDDIRQYLSEKLAPLSLNNKQTNLLVEKCNGNFMYASLLKDSILSGAYSIDNINSLPVGLESFYYQNFHRFFPNEDAFRPVRELFEILIARSDMPKELIMGVLGLDVYEFNNLLKYCSSFISPITIRKNGFTYNYYDFIHKSISDFLCDTDNCDYYVSKANGLNKILQYFLSDNKLYGELIDAQKQAYFDEYITNSLAGLFIECGKYYELLEFLMKESTPLLPHFLILERIPTSVDLSPVLDYLCAHKRFYDFLRVIQSQGRVKYLVFLFSSILKNRQIESLDKKVFEIYIDSIHLSGDYTTAVSSYKKYLSQFDMKQIVEDDLLSRFYIRMLHHGMFFTNVKELLEEAKEFLKLINEDSPNYLELLFLIGGNLGCLYGDFEACREYLNQGYDIATKKNNTNEIKRFTRKLCDIYLNDKQYDSAIELINQSLDVNKIETRYDVYLIGVLCEAYRLKGKYLENLLLLDLMKKECNDRGLVGWQGHEMLARALTLAYSHPDDKEEIVACLDNAKKLYQKLYHHWGLVNESIVREICNMKCGMDTPNDLTKTLELARKMNYNYEIGIVNDLLVKFINDNFHLYFL